MLLTTGWDDPLLKEVVEQYKALRARECAVRLDIGPWTHLGAQREYKDYLEWFDAHFAKDEKSTVKKTGVRVHVNGKWRDLVSWPPSSTNLDFYLRSGKKLARTALEGESEPESESFRFDPSDPTPSIAFPAPFDTTPGRLKGDHPLALRNDVLSYITDPLDTSIEVLGRPTVTLHHSTDNPHADLLLLLSEVHPGNASYTISEIYQRLNTKPVEGSRTVELELSDCGHVFKKGNRIGLLVAGGSHPRYIRNLGTGDGPAVGTEMMAVVHTVHHGVEALSKVSLPVTSGWQDT